MITDYISAAMRSAEYEIMEDGEYYGEIPDFQGVWASARSLDECREILQETLEEWIVLGLKLGHSLPIRADIDIFSVGIAV